MLWCKLIQHWLCTLYDLDEECLIDKIFNLKNKLSNYKHPDNLDNNKGNVNEKRVMICYDDLFDGPAKSLKDRLTIRDWWFEH